MGNRVYLLENKKLEILWTFNTNPSNPKRLLIKFERALMNVVLRSHLSQSRLGTEVSLGPKIKRCIRTAAIALTQAAGLKHSEMLK